MGLFDAILGGQNSDLLNQLANQAGLDQSTVQSVIGELLPAISRGIKTNASSTEGLSGLVNALTTGDHQRYVDNPEVLTNPTAREDGNAILGHIFGSKDVSRNVASHAAAEAGADVSIVKKLLPLVAAAAMGALSKETSTGGSMVGNVLNSLNQGSSNQLSGVITSFLDADKDGDISDDLLNLARKFF